MTTPVYRIGLFCVALMVLGCGTVAEEGEKMNEATRSVDASTPDTRLPAVSMSERGSVAPVPSGGGACMAGTVAACMCPGGTPGTRTCVGDGQYTACGCASASGPDVFVAPKPPVVITCGGTRCAPFEEEETSVSARACCTPDNRCGSSSAFIFGAACVARGADPGVPSEKCPDEAPNFLDLYGCCRPDGQCGLSIDHVANFDLGCIERTEVSALLNAGSGQRDFLSLIFLLPNPKTAFASIRCAAGSLTLPH